MDGCFIMTEQWTEEQIEAVIQSKNKKFISSDVMISYLLTREFMAGYHPTVNGHETDAYVPGTWDTIERSFYRNELTDYEFFKLANDAVIREREDLE